MKAVESDLRDQSARPPCGARAEALNIELLDAHAA